MNRKDLISAVKEYCDDISAEKIDRVLYYIEQEITNAICRDEQVLLKGFLLFKTKTIPSRSGILNGKVWTVEEKTKAVVSLSPSIQQKIKDNKESMNNIDIWDEFNNLPDEVQYSLSENLTLPEITLLLQKFPQLYRKYK